VIVLISTSRIPDELHNFLQKGHTLLIKGDAGTGKTTLALEILRYLEPVDCIFFSTRIPPSILYEYYPWLKQKTVLGPDAIQFLETRQESPVRLLNRLRDLLLKMERPFLVVDTWDAMAAEMDSKEQLRTAKAITITIYGTNGRAVLVAETKETSFLDFLVDGVVSLASTDVYGESEAGKVYEDRLERRSTREIELKKLKGVRIANKRYTFSLEDGRFRSFPPFCEDLSVRPEKITDPSTNCVSSGIPDLDRITLGLKKGSLNLFEVEHSVDMRYLQIHTQIAWNAVKNRKGTIIVPSIGENYPPELLQEVILYRPHASDFESEIKYMKESAEKRFDSGHLRNGLVIFLGFDTILNRFGPDKTLPIIEITADYARESGSTIIGTMKRGMRFLEDVTHTVNSHFIFKDLDNALAIYGMRPKTGLHAVDLIENQVRLIPIV
jgi:KaiC/GvpD/RAD55 family RecA-like ATPase